jgi:hypothetical protein
MAAGAVFANGLLRSRQERLRQQTHKISSDASIVVIRS